MAATAARGDAALGEQVALAVDQAGPDGAVRVEEIRGLDARPVVATLPGGEVVLHLGGRADGVPSHRREVVEEALAATRAAVAEGCVPGGGLALLRCLPAVEREIAEVSGDERAGLESLAAALPVPLRQIASNAGCDPDAAVERLRAATGDIGIDGRCGRYVDLRGAGILDATRVVRVALENAVSTATLLLRAAAISEPAAALAID